MKNQMLLYDNLTGKVTTGGSDILYNANFDYDTCEYMIYLCDTISVNIGSIQAIFTCTTIIIHDPFSSKKEIAGSEIYNTLTQLFSEQKYSEIILKVKDFIHTN
jgi:hypothetical protein